LCVVVALPTHSHCTLCRLSFSHTSHSQSHIAHVGDPRIVTSRAFGVTVCRYPMRLSLASEDLLEQAALKRSIASKFATLSDAY
jgi:hypothetical protein